jgi:gliding motility-associated-like protein
MTRAFLLVNVFLFISVKLLGQCINPPTVSLSSLSGSTCGVTAKTVSGNTFGGSAKRVTITENGSGTVSPTSATKSPFSFTYTPTSGDYGKTVLITVTTDFPNGCVAARATYTLTVNANPTAPVVGLITNPTCSVATGSVVLSGLPSTGVWTLTRSPGGVTTTGTGTSTTISGLTSGTYTFTVTNSVSCTSSSSSNVVIQAQPAYPATPVQTVDCTLGLGRAVVRVTSPVGTGLTYSLDGGVYQSGTSFSNVANGTHSIAVKNSAGCTTTGVSFQVSCPCLSTPTAPIVGAITQPTCVISTGSVILSGLPGTGTWTLTRTPDGVITTGTGTSTTISGLAPGTYTFTVTSAGCVSNPSASVVISAPASSPNAPIVGTVTQPTCTVSTGSVILTGLPSTGTWTLTRTPGNVTTTGSGTSISIPILSPGTYTYKVTNSVGCISASSDYIVITAQPVIPAAPIVGSITAPTCALSTGSVVLNGLPGTGIWLLTRYPGSVTASGTGSSITLSNIPTGMYNYTVTSLAGCVSAMSANVIIPAQPVTPSAPIIGTIVQPVHDLPTGSVVLNGLPESGNWTLIRFPGNVTTSGTGTSTTISGLAEGVYSYTINNSAGCTSFMSASFGIYIAGAPSLVITDPLPVCFPATVDLTAPTVTAGSALNLIYTYWTDQAASIAFTTPASATAGTYYIKGTNQEGFFTIKPVIVLIYKIPVVNAGPNQSLFSQFGVTMNAEIVNNYESGVWSVVSGTGEFFDSTYAKTSVSKLSIGKNIFLWTITNKVCPPSCDTVQILVREVLVPTLITPNMDGKNDFLVVKGYENIGKIELTIFDRRGVQVYRKNDYDNSWNGVDYSGKMLPEDTYFYILKSGKGISASGYVVVRF